MKNQEYERRFKVLHRRGGWDAVGKYAWFELETKNTNDGWLDLSVAYNWDAVAHNLQLEDESLHDLLALFVLTGLATQKGQLYSTPASLKAADKQMGHGKYSKRKTRIYLMVDANTGYTKIGRSNRPETREATLQSEKPTIEMIGHWPGTHAMEAYLHEAYDEKRVRGEWFKLRPSDIEDIKAHLERVTA